MAAARRRAAERAAARDPGQWGLDRSAFDLQSNADIAVTADAAGRPARARRQDVFDVFQSRGRLTAVAVQSVRRLQADLAVLHGSPGSVAAYAERIDRQLAFGGGGEQRRRAAQRIEIVLAGAGAASGRLLLEMFEAEAALGQRPDWRAAVERATGERLADAQGAVLRVACENLAEAYARLDRGFWKTSA